MNPIAFEILGFSVRWYSLFILAGVFIAIWLISEEGKRFNVNSDFLFNMAFWTIIVGIICARAYYVIFNFDLYKGDILSIFKIWEGGLAIHGGIIGGLVTIILYCRKYKVYIPRILDFCVPALLIAQAIGRWGNFFNSEAHGPATSLEYLQSLHLPQFIIDGMNIGGIYYEPTFLYESILCLVGFIIVLIIRRLRYVKIGTCTCFYLMYYGAVRFFIESLRTDSLMLGPIKVAQVVSIIMFIVGLLWIMILSRKGRFEMLYNEIETNQIKY